MFPFLGLYLTGFAKLILPVLAILAIILATIYIIAAISFRNHFKKDIREGINSTAREISLLKSTDIEHLPAPIKKYLAYVGCIGQPKVNYFTVQLKGELRSANNAPWMPFSSEQHNFIPTAWRLFFLKATMKNLPVAGYHRYQDGEAFMDIRLFSLFKVQYQSGREMGIAETVTFFNDMCCMAPAALIDERITWGNTQGNKVEAKFTVNGITISAVLIFNDEGKLVNFLSNDRYALQSDGSLLQCQWSTPLRDYREVNGYTLARTAEAIFAYPEGGFTYGKFQILNISYDPEK